MDLTGPGARSEGAVVYRFDGIVVDPAAHSLSRNGTPQPLEPKAFAVLLALLQRPGELIARDDLLDLVWGHRHVTPGVLTRVIAQLRHALDDDSQRPRYIQTRHALGYRFIGQLQPDADLAVALPGDPVTATAPPSADQPDIAAGPPVSHAATAPIDALAADARVMQPPPIAAPIDLPLASSHANARLPASAAATVSQPAPAQTLANPNWSSANPTAAPRPTSARWLLLGGLLLLAVAVLWSMRERHAAAPPRVAASIAVMPFTSLDANPGDDYFAEGLAEEMRDALAGVKGLKVAASVAPAARAGSVDARALGARLGVASILDASVRREGSRMRITARLTDTRTGFTLWSHAYDRGTSDVFDTQREIAGQVVHALLGVMPGRDSALARRLAPTQNEAAFDTYLQGLQLLHKATGPDAADRAIARFGQALQQDHGFARAQAGICRAEIWRFQGTHSATAFGNAKQACARAAQMDPTLAEVDLALGDLYRAAGDNAQALQHYRASAQAPAMRVNAHLGMAKVYAAQGQHQQALDEFQQALALSPGDASVHAEIGYQHYLDGDVPQAVASYRRAVELEPGSAELWGTLGALYMEAGDNANAATALERAIAIAPAADTLTNLGLLRYQAGDYAAAAALQRQAITLDPEDFMTWGNLGVALRADPSASAADVRHAFEQAATRAQHYIQLKRDDARAVASLALYRAMLGDTPSARRLVQQSESLHGQPGEVALLNAETLALLGDLGAARAQLATARAAGIANTLIASNDTFRRLGLLATAATASPPGGAEPPAPRSTAGHPPGG